MANLGPTFWYTDSVQWTAVTAWATGATIAAGARRRQLAAPTVGNERVFVCIVAGTTHATTEPTWVITKGAKTTDNTVTWQECTGQPGVNGDLTHTPTWAQQKAFSAVVTIGHIIQDAAADCLFIVGTAGTMGASEPTWNKTAGVTTADSGVTWISLGAPANYGKFACPHARLANAFVATWGAAGDTFFVSDNHAETQTTSLTLTAPGTIASPNFVYCADHTIAPPSSTDLKTTATITVSAGATNLTITGYVYFYGIIFQAASNYLIAQAAASWVLFDTCSVRLTGATGQVIIGGTGGNTTYYVEWYNTTFSAANVANNIAVAGAYFKWSNTASAIIGAAVPTTLFQPAVIASLTARIIVDSVDLSALGSGKTIVSVFPANQQYQIINCKLGASVTSYTAPTSRGGATVDVIRSDSGATGYRMERGRYEGILTPETTIVRTGGASDGTTPVAWKIVTTANSLWVAPFEAFPIGVWNDVTGSPVTVTVYGIWGGGAVPNTDDIWIDVEYPGSASFPQGSFINSTKANNLAAGSALGSDASSWGGSTTAFKMAVTFTPNMKGPLTVAVKAAKVSTTFYIDPEPVLS